MGDTPTVDDEALAALLGPGLKPARGPAPKLSHIRAAILMARDAQLGSREACRRVAGVPQGAHDRIAVLAPHVRELLRQWTGAASVDMAATTAVPADAAATAVPAEAGAAPATRPPAEPSPADSKSSLDEVSAFGLPPLRAVPTDPVPLRLPSPPPLPESPLQWSPGVEQPAVPQSASGPQGQHLEGRHSPTTGSLEVSSGTNLALSSRLTRWN